MPQLFGYQRYNVNSNSASILPQPCRAYTIKRSRFKNSHSFIPMIRILLVDDHMIVRSALKFILRDLLPDAVVVETNNSTGTLAEIKKNNFDLIVLDMNLGDAHFNTLIREILHINFSTKILVFTMNSPVFFAKHVLRSGAAGFLNKDASEKIIADAIQAVLAGKTYITPYSIVAENPFETLSDKEFEIMILVAKGKQPSEIASLLDIKPTTVTSHQKNIFAKLNVTTKGALTQLALKYNLWQ